MGKPKKKTLAQKADKYTCYQKSVQSPEHEVDFFEQAFKDEFGRKPKTLREDFCGTYAICCEWVKRGRERTALGVDLDPEPIAWGTEHNLDPLTPTQKGRVKILEQDVRKKNRPRVDVLAAQNFSFWYFKTRAEVIEYFEIARANMADEGIMVMDMMGGGGCYEEGRVDKRTIKKGKKGFRYFWTQESFNLVQVRRRQQNEKRVHLRVAFLDDPRSSRNARRSWIQQQLRVLRS